MDKNNTNQGQTLFDEVIVDLLANLKERSRKIFVARFGLEGSDSQVLGAIGKRLGVTRERIRQIEKEGIKKIKKKVKSEKFEKIVSKVMAILEKEGGFCEKQYLSQQLDQRIGGRGENQLFLILSCAEGIGYRKGSVISKGFWFVKKSINDREVVNTHRFVVRYLKKHLKPVSFDQLKTVVFSSPLGKWTKGNEQRLKNILAISRLVGCNILGQYGMKTWPIISQRGNRERAYLVLKKEGQPTHFRKITQKINEYFSGRKALPQTVHNELIKDERFVLAGRGIYALKEWGYSGNTVGEVIEQILATAGTPMTKDEIIERVLKVKRVKKMTILVNLADRKRFSKNKEGKYQKV